MRYLGVLLSCALAFTPYAQAQRGMGMASRSFGHIARPAPAPSRIGVFPHHGAPSFGPINVRPNPFGPFFGGRRFFPGRFGSCQFPFCRSVFFHRGFFNRFGRFNSFGTFGAFPFAYGYGYPFFSYGYSDTDYSAAAPQQYPQQYDVINQLSNELAEERGRREALESEVERLQQPQPPVPTHAQQSAVKPEPAVLVFRDGTQKEVENYVIFGPTLFAFAPEGTKKIRTADLNLPATKKANETRGIDFRLPREGELNTYP